MTLRELRDNNPVPGCITQPGHTLLTDCTDGHTYIQRSPTPASYSYISVFSAYYVLVIYSAANRLIGEVVQLRRRPLLGPSRG